MQTRSQIRAIMAELQQEKDNSGIPDKYEVNIDFDAASIAWRKNKISIGDGSFKYKKEKKKRFPETACFPLV